ncbi:pyridoxamine 5'-phosphate oxidase family protein [Mesorhizobium sp. M7A.F.Ca.US.010.02.1.1]|uniref:pyridoxamine 5'-phosphate oxidase family protein n=1 Tax=Mesorhizobium sp. M7A.F.Ca.US.010.02.1.1 TaxID=2496743 RepID=UPI000FD1E098|nr:pyridoxamine 5'-phosphate oxidase family protein [Mesorhizobium sp. M7A.F.Ca.US.010.02.1.1]RUW86899.1 pyridoxamine 5'-phosphate oxidase family protein [Mesorhizobium sp. M7A.F.Ca.US.010.02.1.1]
MINILARCMDMTIATARSDGSPQATVVSFVHDGLLLYFGCGGMMVQRFPQISAIQPSEAAPVKLFRVRPTIISVLDYSLGFGHTDLVKIIAETLDSMRHHWLVGTSATA